MWRPALNTPGRVMALTFTQRAAAELRLRLRGLGAGGVAARTFHAAALSQLGFFWPQVVGGSAPSIIDGKARVLAHAAERIGMKVDTATLRDVAGEIEWRKVSGLSLEQYEAAVTRGRPLPDRMDTERMLAMQVAYEQLKDERRQLDFEDVLLVTAGMIEQEPSVAMQVREQYRFFVGRRVPGRLAGAVAVAAAVDGRPPRPLRRRRRQPDDLLVRGRLLRLPPRVPLDLHGCHGVVRLESNYRSAPPIIDAANRLMRGRPGAFTLHPATTDAAAAAVTQRSFPTDRAEARAVAQSIVELVDAGARPEQIAVLYRVNVQGALLEEALGDVGVSYQVRGSRRFFDLPEVKQAVLALRAASVSIIGEPLFKSVSDVLRSLGWSQSAPEVRGAVRDRWESLNAIMGLVDAAEPDLTFRRFTDELLERQAGQHDPTLSAVTLATLHAAKGLEWEHVFVVGLSEGLVPISFARSFDAIDEERRLLYVGITRARSTLGLSWASVGQQQRSNREPSRFLAELDTRTPGAARAARSASSRHPG